MIPTSLNPKLSTLTTLSTSTTPHFLSHLLNRCNSLPTTTSLHQHLLVHNLLSSPPLSTALLQSYLNLSAPTEALKLLLHHHHSSPVFGWNLLFQYHLTNNQPHHSLSLFRQMLRLSKTQPDHYTFPFLLKASADLRSLPAGVSLHALLLSRGFSHNVFACNAVVAFYSRCGAIEDARKAFDEITDSNIDDVVSWNSIVSAYVKTGNPRTALDLFSRMPWRADVISLVNILRACASLRESSRAREIHGFAVRSGTHRDVFVGNAVVDVYAKCGKMGDAVKIFDRMERKDVVSWNAMVTGYSQNGFFDDAMRLFERMREEEIELNVVTWSAVVSGYAQRGYGHEAIGVFRGMQHSGSEPNAVTIISLLSACASVGALLQGRETHCHSLRRCLMTSCDDEGEDLMVQNALIDMYSKCKSFDEARSLFDSTSLEERSVVTWTVMIGGHAQHGDANSALELFATMFGGDSIPVTPNAFTISCALMACARLSALRAGREIHAYMIRNEYGAPKLFVANCLIDMYSKCGDIDGARRVFDGMSQKNDVSWTSLMNGYGLHGRGSDALLVFERMQEAGLTPDGVTFLVVLYACSHSGMIEQGLDYFHSMARDHGVVVGAEHYACAVDLLGRAGRIEEAWKMIQSMPMNPKAVVWVSLLSACRVHSNVELGEYASRKLLELESDNDGSYTLLSNIYANAGRWSDVARIRSLMRRSGIRKRPGCSWIQGKKGTATFFVGDRTHSESQQIYALLGTLMERIKALGYVPQTKFALHDVDDEEKSSLLSEHSEKLALAFGILTSSPGIPIRITKNLRVCGDCHSAITFISEIVEHEIILRDSSRFHHFKKGLCSCGGYW